MALTSHELQIVQVRLNSVSNEGHFTLEVEAIFRLYLLSHYIGVTQINHTALPAHALRARLVRLK
jgi:hypothetical protein